MKPGSRLLLAFVVGPLATFPVAVCIFVLWPWLSVPAWGSTVYTCIGLRACAFTGWIALILAYSVMAVVGIPIGLALRKLNLYRAPVMALAGALAGTLPSLFLTRSALRNPHEGDPSALLLLLVAGVLSGAASAWLVWRISSGGSRSLPASPTDQKERTAMLTVLYDGRCALCRRARAWLDEQSKYVPLDYVAAGSPQARGRFPGLDHDNTLVDLTVVGMNGEVYYGAKAWIMCLWALKKYRGTALRLATPELMPSAKRVIAWVSRNRFKGGQGAAWRT